jgi:hypothetical protein
MLNSKSQYTNSRNDQYKNAFKLRKKLLLSCEGKSLEDVFKGTELSTEGGTCYNIKNESKLKFNTLSIEKARKKILSDLKLLSGVGDVKAHKLRSEGFHSIEDLIEHDTHKGEARKLLKIIDDCDTCKTADWISDWYPNSHPLVLFSSSFNDESDFIFLDIETMGLYNQPIILLGLAWVSGKKISVNQYLCRSLRDENAVLSSFLYHVVPECVYVTFNGQTFDIPFIINRMKNYNIRRDLDNLHFDLLHYSRRAWSDELPNCQLTTIEKYIFGIDRKDDIPSGLVPEFYRNYNIMVIQGH